MIAAVAAVTSRFVADACFCCAEFGGLGAQNGYRAGLWRARSCSLGTVQGRWRGRWEIGVAGWIDVCVSNIKVLYTIPLLIELNSTSTAIISALCKVYSHE